MNILIISPHPDDELLGCGGTIKKYSKKGNNIYLCVVTKGYTPDWSEEFTKNKVQEVKKVNKVLGIKKSFFLNFPTVKLDSVLQKDLNGSISDIVKKVKPEIVFIPHFGDLNKDHRLVHEAALVATRPLRGSSDKRILAYETPSETEWGPLSFPFVATSYQNIESTIKYKLEAMAVYKSELKSRPRSLEVLEALAKKRGSEAGFKFAEAFMVVREINI